MKARIETEEQEGERGQRKKTIQREERERDGEWVSERAIGGVRRRDRTCRAIDQVCMSMCLISPYVYVYMCAYVHVYMCICVCVCVYVIQHRFVPGSS